MLNKKNTFAEYTLEEFSSKLASKAPTPGGGSVAGLSTTLASALIEMVINLTDDIELDNFSDELKEKREEALTLIDKDADSFNQVMDAFKMPKDTEEEKVKRKEAIQKGLKAASITPLDTMKLGLELLKIARQVIDKGNPHAISDIGVAGLMAEAAIKGAHYNVLINTSSLKDENEAKQLEKEAKEIINKAEAILPEIEEITINKIKN